MGRRQWLAIFGTDIDLHSRAVVLVVVVSSVMCWRKIKVDRHRRGESGVHEDRRRDLGSLCVTARKVGVGEVRKVSRVG